MLPRYPSSRYSLHAHGGKNHDAAATAVRGYRYIVGLMLVPIS